MSFAPAKEKLTIASLDDSDLEVEAQYNPKELQVDTQIPWHAAPQRDNRPAWRRPTGKQDDVEYKGGSGRSMTIELLFDGYETGVTVEPTIELLQEMASVRDPASKAGDERRPHHCIVVWGNGGRRPFECVIESISTKYSVFDTKGIPLRAVCTVKLREAKLASKGILDERHRFVGYQNSAGVEAYLADAVAMTKVRR